MTLSTGNANQENHFWADLKGYGIALIVALVMILIGMSMSAAEAQEHHNHDRFHVPHLNTDTFREMWGVQMKTPPEQQLAHGENKRDDRCRLGYFLCNHAYFHPVYLLLQLITGESCCHDSEGRPTRDVEELDPHDPREASQIAAGFRYKAWVDGQWCPATEKALMKISETQKATFLSYKKTNPDLFFSFMEYDHVFAPKSIVFPDGIARCPTIYCIYKKIPPT